MKKKAAVASPAKSQRPPVAATAGTLAQDLFARADSVGGPISHWYTSGAPQVCGEVCIFGDLHAPYDGPGGAPCGGGGAPQQQQQLHALLREAGASGRVPLAVYFEHQIVNRPREPAAARSPRKKGGGRGAATAAAAAAVLAGVDDQWMSPRLANAPIRAFKEEFFAELTDRAPNVFGPSAAIVACDRRRYGSPDAAPASTFAALQELYNRAAPQRPTEEFLLDLEVAVPEHTFYTDGGAAAGGAWDTKTYHFVDPAACWLLASPLACEPEFVAECADFALTQVSSEHRAADFAAVIAKYPGAAAALGPDSEAASHFVAEAGGAPILELLRPDVAASAADAIAAVADAAVADALLAHARARIARLVADYARVVSAPVASAGGAREPVGDWARRVLQAESTTTAAAPASAASRRRKAAAPAVVPRGFAVRKLTYAAAARLGQAEGASARNMLQQIGGIVGLEAFVAAKIVAAAGAGAPAPPPLSVVFVGAEHAGAIADFLRAAAAARPPRAPPLPEFWSGERSLSRCVPAPPMPA
jgi:hypothetical protein